MRICYFGTYDPAFPRNAIIVKGLRSNGVEVVECNQKAWASTEEKMRVARSAMSGIIGLLRLVRCYIQLVIKYFLVGKHDLIMVGYPGHLDVFVAKPLSILTRRPLAFDAFLSLFETAVEDRRIVASGSFRAGALRLIDRYSCVLSDLVLLDTFSHIDYFVDEFHLPRAKFQRVFATADEHDYQPANSHEPVNRYRVIYFGQFIPLHGVEHIVGAAFLLKDYQRIRFVLCGTGQMLGEMKAKAAFLGLDNIEFIETWMSPQELSRIIDSCNLCLGIFGDSGKAQRVIPNKIFVALAKAMPVLSGDSPAMRELFTSDDTVFLCQAGDASALAEAILRLEGNRELGRSVGLNGYSHFKSFLAPSAVASDLKEVLRVEIEKR